MDTGLIGADAHKKGCGHAWPLAYVGGPKIGFGLGCAGAHVSNCIVRNICMLGSKSDRYISFVRFTLFGTALGCLYSTPRFKGRRTEYRGRSK